MNVYASMLSVVAICSVTLSHSFAEDKSFVRFGVQVAKPKKERFGVVVKKVWDDYPSTHIGRIKDKKIFSLKADQHLIVIVNGTKITSPEQFVDAIQNSKSFVIPIGVYDRTKKTIDLCVACLRDKRFPMIKTREFLEKVYLPMVHEEFKKTKDEPPNRNVADLKDEVQQVKIELDNVRARLRTPQEPEVRLPLVARELILNSKYFDLRKKLADAELEQK